MDILVESLIEFYTEAEIRAAWQAVLAAHVAQVQTDVVIVSQTTRAGGANGEIVVTPSMRISFMKACRDAIADYDGSLTVPDGHTFNFFTRPLRT